MAPSKKSTSKSYRCYYLFSLLLLVVPAMIRCIDDSCMLRPTYYSTLEPTPATSAPSTELKTANSLKVSRSHVFSLDLKKLTLSLVLASTYTERKTRSIA